MSAVKLSSQNQMSLPKDARECLGVKGGDEIEVVPQGRIVVLMAKPKNIVDQLYGMAKGMYKPDSKTYLKRERESWERRLKKLWKVTQS